jgi:type II secretory pathway component GspD/PulD (secretin)
MMRVTLQNRYEGVATEDMDVLRVQDRSIDTTLLVKNGETIVLGGLTIEKDKNNVDGVPILKDLPLLGYIFRYEEDSKDRQELMLIVRPTIIPVGSKRDVVYAPVSELNHTSTK